MNDIERLRKILSSITNEEVTELLDEVEALRKQCAEPVLKVTDEIVEEMAKLFHEANNYLGSWDGPDCPFKNSIRVGMRAALTAAGIEMSP